MIWFITFGNHKYKNSLKLIQYEATSFELFDTIIGYTEKDLQEDTEFWSQHGEFIRKNPRGYGYWIWKPYLILKTLNQMSEGDCLIYADAGCQLNLEGKPVLEEWIENLKETEQGVLLFDTSYKEGIYTKGDIFEYFNCHELTDSIQRLAGIQFICCKAESIAFYKELVEHTSKYDLISDKKSSYPNTAGFQEHRHDQSILSILSKLRNIECMPRKTTKEYLCPIWTVRRKG
jgi:hypothetical protein